jgi:uncharacterized membrane protein YbhN (UPF0104 family)
VAVACSLVSMGCFARLQRRMLHASGVDVPIGRVLGAVYAANAVNTTLPGGTALAAGYLVRRFTRWGASGPAAGFTVLACGVLSSVTFGGLVLGGGLLAGHGAPLYCALGLGLLGVVLLTRRHRLRAGVRLAERGLVRFNRAAHRDADRGVAALRRFTAELAVIRPRQRDWMVGGGFAALNWLADLGCLVAACHAVGLGGGRVALILTAYLAGMTASSISVLPGGFGIVDVAMVLALTSGSVSSTSATAAVLLYRLISCLFIVGLGWGAWLQTRRLEAGSA